MIFSVFLALINWEREREPKEMIGINRTVCLLWAQVWSEIIIGNLCLWLFCLFPFFLSLLICVDISSHFNSGNSCITHNYMFPNSWITLQNHKNCFRLLFSFLFFVNIMVLKMDFDKDVLLLYIYCLIGIGILILGINESRELDKLTPKSWGW